MPDSMLVVNVDTWGSGPNALTKGDVVPSDCPGDLDWAAQHKVIVPADEYRLEHPDWKPPTEKEAEPAPARTPTTSRTGTTSS